MAKAEKKKRKGFVHKMMFGNEDKPDLTPEQLNMSKWGPRRSRAINEKSLHSRPEGAKRKDI